MSAIRCFSRYPTPLAPSLEQLQRVLALDVLRQHEHRQSTAAQSAARAPPAGRRRLFPGGMRMSVTTRSGRRSTTCSTSVRRIAGDGHHLDPALLEHQCRALAHQRLVLADHDPHGTSTARSFRRRTGCRPADPPAEGVDAIGDAAQPGAPVVARPADAVVADLHAQVAADDVQTDGHPLRARVLEPVGQALGDDEERGALHRRPAGRSPPATNSVGMGMRSTSSAVAASSPRSISSAGITPWTRLRSSSMAASIPARTSSASRGRGPARRGPARVRHGWPAAPAGPADRRAGPGRSAGARRHRPRPGVPSIRAARRGWPAARHRGAGGRWRWPAPDLRCAPVRRRRSAWRRSR